MVWGEVAALTASQVQETHLALGQTLDMVHLRQAMKSEEETPGISKISYLRNSNRTLLMDEGNIRIILECVREASGQQKIQPDVWQYI